MVEVKELSQRRGALLQERRTWEADWKLLSQHFLPRKMRSLEEEGDVTNRGGLRKDILRNTGVLAMRDLAAGMHGGMTSPARPWFRLSLQDESLATYKPVRVWLDDCQDRMRTMFHRSNFYNVVHSMYAQLGTFGTGFMFELEDERSGIRFMPLAVGEYVLDIDENGRVDTIFRSCPMTVRQLVRRFGFNNCPDTVKRMFEAPARGMVDRFTAVHAVMPRDDRNPQKLDRMNMPYASTYYLEAGEGGTKTIGGGLQYPHLLAEGGFRSFPGFGPRWDVTGMDVYGDSPCMDVLGNVLQMQSMERSKLKALQKLVDPPMAKPSGVKGLSLLPGAENVYDMQGSNQPIYPLLQIRPDTQGVMMALEDLKNEIKSGLYNDLFKMLMGSDRRQITAREIAAREEEKLILLGPVLERLHDELFMPMIDRTWELMTEQNMMPEPPVEVQGQEIKVEFVSLLAQAQKMVSTSAVDQFMGFVGAYSQVLPDLLDAVDTDKMADGYAGYLGLETDMLRAQEDRDAMREQRAQQMAQAQQAEQMAAMGPMAQSAKNLSETQIGGEKESALDALLGSFGGV